MPEPREPFVVLAHSPREWASRVHFFLADHGGAAISGYALTAHEALEADADVLIIDDTCSFLSRKLVDDLSERGTRVVGVFDAADGAAGERRLETLGIEVRVESASAPDEFVCAVAAAASRLPAERRPASAPVRPPLSGRVVAVAAAGGGAGATEVAISLAAMVGTRRAPVCVVDADPLSPSVAQRLGLPPRPDLATVVEEVHHGEGLPEDLPAHAAGVRVLAGSHPKVAPHLDPADVVAVVDEAARRFGTAVVDTCSIALSTAQSFSGIAAVGRAVVDAAHDLVLVAHGSPVGVARVAAWIGAVGRRPAAQRLHVVVNHLPAGRFRSAELVVELQRMTGPDSVSAVPFDRRLRLAEWRGDPAGRGPFRRGLMPLAADLGEQRHP